MRKGFFGLAVAGLLSPVALAAGPQLISAVDFGAAWPFTVEEMHLSCLPGNAVVVMDSETGAMYPVNGAASSRAEQLALDPLDKVWRDNPEIEGLKISVGPVIEQGLKLCK